MYFKHVKGLIWALAVSGFLNIILLTSIFYWMIKEHSPALYCEQKPSLKLVKQAPLVVGEASRALILRLQVLPYEQLILRLKSNAPVENGYTERCLAVACLVAFHHFDLSRALEGSSYVVQERLMIYGPFLNGSQPSIKMFSGLTDRHFAAIVAFADSERWPQTPRGLFSLLQLKKGNVDGSLLDAFVLTPEFMAIESVFKRLDPLVEKGELVNFLLEGDWQMLANISEQQRLYGNLSDTRRRKILLEYIQKGSATAAAILLKVDGSLGGGKSEDLFESPLKNVELPKPQVIAAKSPVSFEKGNNDTLKIKPLGAIKPSASAPKADRLYIVQEGDNLWKLSRRFNVDVDVLRRYNKLSSDALIPSSALRIPAQ